MRKALVAVGIALFASAALADEYYKRTEVTLNEPVIVAGVPTVTLAPGKYVLRLMSHEHSRNIVQIYNERENKLFTTVLAIPNYKLEATDKTEFRFWETPKGNPIALRSWFPNGENYGQEFVYPKGLAAKIAAETGEPVLIAKAETVEELETAPITEVTKSGEEQPLEEAFTPPEPEPAPAVAEAAPAPEPEPEPEPLPPTASPFFAIGLFGAITAAAGAALRRLAVRS
jgi:hypothetical protein